MKRKSVLAIAIALVFVLSLSMLTACGAKHEFSSEWQHDETSHFHKCTIQDHTDVADQADHTFDAGVVTTAPTEAAEGVKTYTCTVCGYQKTAPIDRLAHVHTFNDKKWESDETNHWHPATCAHIGERDAVAPHDWNDGEITTPAGYVTTGTKTYTC